MMAFISSKQDKIFISLCLSLSFLISGIFLIYYTKHPGCCDTKAYVDLARHYAQNGMTSKGPSSELRTYLYPLILSYLLRLSKFSSIPLEIVVWIFQLIQYQLVSIFVFSQIANKSYILAKYSLIVLSINIFLLPYIPIALTDLTYCNLAILWMFVTIKFIEEFDNNNDCNKLIFYISLSALIAGLILITRPAGIWISLLTFLLLLCKVIKHVNKTNISRLLSIVVISISSFLFPLIPQIYINSLIFNKITPLPVVELGKMQITWGIQYIKYGTNLSGGSLKMFYINPYFISNGDTTLLWYLENPITSSKTLLLKLIGSFDFDYIYPYVYDLAPLYRWPSAAISLSILYLGSWGIYRYSSPLQRKHHTHGYFFGPPFFPIICFVGWASVTLISAVELRFTLPMLVVLAIFSTERIMYISKLRGKILAKCILCYFVSISCLLLVANYISKMNILLNKG